MMIHQAGRTVIRSHSIPCYFISTRVSPLLSISLRVSAKYYAKYSSDFLLRTQATARQFSGQRTYATRPVSRPKAHTGRITASPRTKKTQKVVVEGEALVKEGTDTVATPKSTPKSKPKTKASRKFSSNTTPKSKPKRKVKAKAKPKRKVKAKEPLTEEGKAAAAVKEKRKQIRELKVTALNVPKLKPSTVWSLVNEEVTKEKRRLAASDASDMYRNLIPEEIEHYNQIANQNKADNAKAYKSWIQSFTPDDIRKANNARNQLKRLGVKGYRNNLRDDRLIRRPTPAHSFFLKDRYSTGQMHGMDIGDATRLITREWRELGDADKQKYYEYQAQSQTKYAQGVKDTYHQVVDFNGTTPKQAGVATAA